jgi:cardiolipin synthase (CMP-forming)
MFNNLPNQLTLARILIIPVIVALMAFSNFGWAAWTALILFILAALTDWLDGWLARRNAQTSRIGQFLDPVADKLLVAAVILMLVNQQQISGISILPAVIILLREVAVSGLREFLADLKVSVPVSKLAKWKTAIQFFALAFLMIGTHAPDFIPAVFLGDILLWVAGVLTVVTAWDYWRASLKHF